MRDGPELLNSGAAGHSYGTALQDARRGAQRATDWQRRRLLMEESGTAAGFLQLQTGISSHILRNSR